MLTRRADHRGHENPLPEIRRFAEANLGFFKRNRRFLRFVDTRQKWLLVHLIAVTCHPGEGPAQGAAANWICERASELGIASRNTSLGFFTQLAAYGYLQKREYRGDRRIRLVSLSEGAMDALHDWTRSLVEMVTGMDAGVLDSETVNAIYLETVTCLLGDRKWLKAPLDICLTQDMRGGWLAMSEILRHLLPAEAGEAWLPAPGVSLPAMTGAFGLSRSTVYRLVRHSVEAGIMEWQERQAVNTLAINRYHLDQYSRWVGRLLQAVALACGAVSPDPRQARETAGVAPAADPLAAGNWVLELPQAAPGGC